MQLVLVHPRPRPLRGTNLLSLMHEGWRATVENGRNHVGSVTVHSGDWDRVVPSLGVFLKADDLLGYRLWGATVVQRPSLPPGRVLFRDSEGNHRATAWWLVGEPREPARPPPLLVVTVAQKPA